MACGQFYTVSTPIGNLNDISKRAIDTLSSVDYIACEDKRVSSILLSEIKVSKQLIVYQKHNEQEASDKIIDLLKSGKNIALVSDAGVPCISDPGKIIVKKLFEQGIKTTSIPGACAITAILSSAPRKEEEFAFCGFLPRTKPSQEKLFEKFKDTDLVFYESPKRLMESLENIAELRGKEQKIAISRELTKKFEEIICDTVDKVSDYYSKNTLKGEITGILYKTEVKQNADFNVQIKKLKKVGFSSKDIAIIISNLYGANKKEIYSIVNELK